ncbi:MAG: CPBP family intramembrane metalloprotease [Lachnospiraceae bacterium]|nr:CPBP family intramembrane metalloprotease [Lachnospiraceae bacterium]
MKELEKKKLWIFIAVAYGVAYAMNIVMIIGFKKEYDLSSFVATQMMYPACGVILGKLIFGNKDVKLPKAGYITVLVTTFIMIVMSLMSVIFYIKPLELGGVSVDIWYTALSVVIMIGSIVAYILFWTCGKEQRINAGLQRSSFGWGVVLIIVFVVMLFARGFMFAYLQDLTDNTNTNINNLISVLKERNTIITIITLPLNFFLTWIAFFGEEYGWRYYLQPIMQEKLGKRLGVLALGLVWAVWHLGADLMYYTREYGVQMFISQIITCVAIAIFWGYVYMKTNNIWILAFMHFINNNLAALLNGGGNESLQNQVVTWSVIPSHFISAIVFMLFIFAPLYGYKKQEG